MPDDKADPAESPATPVVTPSGGGFKTWLPLIVTMLLMPALAFGVAQFVILPQLQKGLGIKAAGSKLQDLDDQLPIDMKPLRDLINRGPGLEIFEDGGNRHAGAAKDPRATESPRHAFYSSTLRPIERCHSFQDTRKKVLRQQDPRGS